MPTFLGGVQEVVAAIAGTLIVAAPVAYKMGRVFKSDSREDSLFSRESDYNTRPIC